MIYYKNGFHFMPLIAEYTAYGEKCRKYVEDREWWEDFVQKWWHHQDLSFVLVEPTDAQKARLEEVKDVSELYTSDVALYVESGISNFDNIPSNIDLSNSLLTWQYEKAVDAHILKQVQSLGYDTVDSISKYMARSASPFYTECIALGDWIDACWVKCHELLNAGEMITLEDLIAAMPVYQEE